MARALAIGAAPDDEHDPRFTQRDVDMKGVGAIRTHVLDPSTVRMPEWQPADR